MVVLKLGQVARDARHTRPAGMGDPGQIARQMVSSDRGSGVVGYNFQVAIVKIVSKPAARTNDLPRAL